jgi:hypothetical protein
MGPAIRVVCLQVAADPLVQRQPVDPGQIGGFQILVQIVFQTLVVLGSKFVDNILFH